MAFLSELEPCLFGELRLKLLDYLLKFNLCFCLEAKAFSYAFRVGAYPVSEFQFVGLVRLLCHSIRMELHGVALPNVLEVREPELLTQVVQKKVLNDQYEAFVEIFKGLYLVVKLDQNGLGRHLPVHTIGLPDRPVGLRNINLLQKLLTRRPDGPGCVKCL